MRTNYQIDASSFKHLYDPCRYVDDDVILVKQERPEKDAVLLSIVSVLLSQGSKCDSS